MHQIVNLQGKELYVEYLLQDKSKPTLVFLHDSLGSVQLWRDFPHKIAEETQCNMLLYDRLGYGKSAKMSAEERPNNYMEIEADVLNELFVYLEIENAILFGHSDGGTIVLLAASKYSEKIKGVIAEAAHIFVEEQTIAGVEAAIASYSNTNLPERLAKYHGDKVDRLFKAWTETWTRASYRDWNIEHFLSKISCPLLFIQGELDEYGTLEQVDKTVEQVSGLAEKFILPNTGHTPHKEATDLVLIKTIDFIQNILKS